MNASQRHIFISSFPCVPDRTCVLPFIWRWKATLNWICKCTLLLLLNWTRSVRKFRKQKEQHGLMFFLSLNAHSRSYELQECVRERQHILKTTMKTRVAELVQSLAPVTASLLFTQTSFTTSNTSEPGHDPPQKTSRRPQAAHNLQLQHKHNRHSNLSRVARCAVFTILTCSQNI